MNNLKTRSFLLLFLFLLSITLSCNTLFAQAGGAAAYLKMGLGAKAIGMGEAYVGVAEDGISAHWNPAGLSQLERPEASAMHADLNLDRKYEFLNYAAPHNDKITWAVSWIHSSIDGIERRAGNNDVGYLPGQLMGYFDDKENSFAASMAWKSTEKFSVGTSLKYLKHDLYQNSADGMGLDIGFLYKQNEDFSVGLAVKEIGGSLKWDTASSRKDDVPLNTTLGFMYRPIPKVRMAFDINKIEDLDTKVNFGVEGKLSQNVCLRAGVHDGDLTAGLGFDMNDWSMDYAFEEQELGDIHRISGSIRFGSVPKDDKKEPFTEMKEKAKLDAEKIKGDKKGRKKRRKKRKKAETAIKTAVQEPLEKTVETKVNTTSEKVSNISEKTSNIIGLASVSSQNNVEKLSEMGDKALLKKDFLTAEDCYKKIIKLNSDDANSYFKLGNLYVVKKDLNSAREYYKLGMALNPKSKYSKYAEAVLKAK